MFARTKTALPSYKRRKYRVPLCRIGVLGTLLTSHDYCHSVITRLRFYAVFDENLLLVWKHHFLKDFYFYFSIKNNYFLREMKNNY